MNKKDPTIYCLQENRSIFKGIHRLKMKRWKKKYSTKTETKFLLMQFAYQLKSVHKNEPYIASWNP